MTDPARGPTTEELRARVLAQLAEAAMHEPRRVLDALTADTHDCAVEGCATVRKYAGSHLVRPCLACNREQGERMCDLCLRLELAEHSL